jgi:ketosteroid isomerase-like protein
MSDQNMQNVRRLLEEVWTQGNLALLPELMAEDAVAYPMPQFGTVRGRDEYAHFIAVYKGVFLDMSFHIEDQFASGDKVVTRWVTRVTDAAGDAQHDATTGEQLAIDGITITHHNSDGKIIGEWATWDTQSLLQSASAPRIFEQLAVSV